jgi:hypothetical protein
VTNEEIIEHAKAILHNRIDAGMTELLMEQLQAKLDAMTALELSEYIDERRRRERARNAIED